MRRHNPASGRGALARDGSAVEFYKVLQHAFDEPAIHEELQLAGLRFKRWILRPNWFAAALAEAR
jgi:hypothetical protein